MERSGSTVKLKLKSRFPGGRNVGGKYTMNDHSVTLYLEEIRIQAVNIFGSAEYTDEVLKIIAAHELGHAQDPELELLSERLDECPSDREFNLIALQIEENAWNFARTILPEVESGLLDTMIYFSLKAYRDAVAEGIA
ncbi:hypothetical protein [Paenibacillus pinistramenti]|uniref:hypothetical protein n=1 Tax=Paenibacillus pinistramenti TaxID=1768003 RepID=UPI001EF072A6|nr:hypothetical protein [Paenibacillus pinistramenti]